MFFIYLDLNANPSSTYYWTVGCIDAATQRFWWIGTYDVNVDPNAFGALCGTYYNYWIRLQLQQCLWNTDGPRYSRRFRSRKRQRIPKPRISSPIITQKQGFGSYFCLKMLKYQHKEQNLNVKLTFMMKNVKFKIFTKIKLLNW